MGVIHCVSTGWHCVYLVRKWPTLPPPQGAECINPRHVYEIQAALWIVQTASDDHVSTSDEDDVQE